MLDRDLLIITVLIPLGEVRVIFDIPISVIIPLMKIHKIMIKHMCSPQCETSHKNDAWNFLLILLMSVDWGLWSTDLFSIQVPNRSLSDYIGQTCFSQPRVIKNITFAL